MHWLIRQRVNRLDSQRKQNLKTEELNVILNSAQETLVKTIVSPRYKQNVNNLLGFEAIQRNREDIRNIVVDYVPLKVEKLGDNYSVKLPEDYLFHEASYAICKDCPGKKLRTFIPQKGDLHEENPFEKSDLLFAEINIEFIEGNRIKIYADFEISGFLISYVRRPKKIYHSTSSYIDLDGDEIKGDSECELSVSIHEDIVDYAAYLIAGSLGSSDLNTKIEKLQNIGLN